MTLPKAMTRLCAALQLPAMTTDVTINISAGEMPEMTIRMLLSEEQIDALSEWYVTEGIDRIQHGETTYSLVPREVQP